MQGRHRGPGQQPPGWPGAPAGKDCLVAWAEVQRVSFSHIRTCNPAASLSAPAAAQDHPLFVQAPTGVPGVEPGTAPHLQRSRTPGATSAVHSILTAVLRVAGRGDVFGERRVAGFTVGALPCISYVATARPIQGPIFSL